MTTSNFKKGIKEAFSHPLILILVGAGISGIIVPSITNQWQNHQKELELKSALATQISDAVSKMIVTARLAQNPFFSNDVDYTKAAIDWEESKATIGSQLKAYFPDTPLTQEWDKLSTVITEFVALNADVMKNDTHYKDEICLRVKHVLLLHDYLFPNSTINILPADLHSYNCQTIDNQVANEKYSSNTYPADWNLLVHKELGNIEYSKRIQYGNSWFAVEGYLQNRKENLIQDILRAHVLTF